MYIININKLVTTTSSVTVFEENGTLQSTNIPGSASYEVKLEDSKQLHIYRVASKQ